MGKQAIKTSIKGDYHATGNEFNVDSTEHYTAETTAATADTDSGQPAMGKYAADGNDSLHGATRTGWQ